MFIENKAVLFNEFDKMLNGLILEIERRMELFKYLNVNTIEEANLKMKDYQNAEELKPIILLICSLDDVYLEMKDFGRLIYLSEMGKKCGLMEVVVVRSDGILNQMMKNSFPYKLLFKVNSLKSSLDFIDSDYGMYLLGKGDFILRDKDQNIRLQSGFISIEDFNHLM